MHFLHTLFTHLLPTACIVCTRHQTKMVCPACFAFLENQSLFHYPCCIRCGVDIDGYSTEKNQCSACLLKAPAFDRTHCLDRYDGVLQNAMHQLKYQRRLAIADAIAFTWSRLALPHLDASEAAVLLPVPLSTQRLSHRGFNQSWEIAKRIRLPPSIELIANALGRHHSDANQVEHNRLDRQTALRHAFYIRPEALAKIQNKSIVVFDDVMTTGSTLREIATLLKDNGARSVVNWVVLRTLRPQTRIIQGIHSDV
jgi:ComF family protein